MTLDLTGCYYRRLDADGEFQVFESTELTASGWGPNLQHGSPPMALLLKAIEELPEPRENLRIGRVALDILGPVPLEPVRVRAWIERPAGGSRSQSPRWRHVRTADTARSHGPAPGYWQPR